MRRKFNTRQRNYIILGLCSILLVMAAGYAAFRSQLTINGTSNISSEWKVLITDIQSSVLNGTPENSEEPSHTDTTATFKTNLVSPGDSMQYTVTVENRGSIDAVLKTLSKTDSNNQAIIFEITGIEQGDTLKAHESTTFNVTVTYNKDVTNQPANLTSDLTITLDYVQAGTNDEGTVLPNETNLMRSYSSNSQADYHSDEYRERITSIEVLNNKNVPSDAVESWDVSERQNGSVMAWIVNDPENAGFYKLYIGGDGGVVANPNSSYLFDGFTNVKEIIFNDNFDTTKVTNMQGMIRKNPNLTSLDLSSFNTSNVTNMVGMVSENSNIKTINLSNFDTRNVTTMAWMFNLCTNLTNLDLSSFNTSKVTNMAGMFAGAGKLISINFGNDFYTNKVKDMSLMFVNCVKLNSLDLSTFYTDNVTNMKQMFNNCLELRELDLSSFDTRKVTDMSVMFSGDNQLTTIYVGPNWSTDGTDIYGMFNSCGTDHVTLKSS